MGTSFSELFDLFVTLRPPPPENLVARCLALLPSINPDIVGVKIFGTSSPSKWSTCSTALSTASEPFLVWPFSVCIHHRLRHCLHHEVFYVLLHPPLPPFTSGSTKMSRESTLACQKGRDHRGHGLGSWRTSGSGQRR